MSLGGDDAVASLPQPIGTITYDEWHAALLAITPGWLIGFGLLLGKYEVVFYLGLAMLSTAGVIQAKDIPKVGPYLERLGISVKNKCPSTATKAAGVIRREAWYFLTVLSIIAAGTYGVGSWPWL